MRKREGLIIFSEIESFKGLKKALKLGREATIKLVKDSNIKGRGGAGFPTGLKWDLANKIDAPTKCVICNADEGEPGTFKDQALIKEYANLVLEGILIAGYAIGASKGYIYLRGEYQCYRSGLEEAIKNLVEENLLGEKILGKKDFNFEIRIRMGTGAYVCGEETALIEAMEGQRGEPRNRPPYPVTSGYLAAPTVVNNVETLAAIPHILSKGADWFKSFGTENSTGTKLLSISGDCKKPGVYEVPFGISVKEVLEMVEATNVKAVQIGGASGTCISASEFNRKISFEDIPTGGSIMIFDKNRNMVDMVENFLEFFEDESCGQCTPCREGISVLLEGVEKIKSRECTKYYLRDLSSLCETMQIASKCGLGQTAPNAFVDVINKFKGDFVLSDEGQSKEVFNGQ